MIGNILVKALPLVIKGLTEIGTIALLLVVGGIFVHYIPYFHHLSEEIKMPAIIKEFVVGLVLGFAVLLVINLVKKIFKKKTA